MAETYENDPNTLSHGCIILAQNFTGEEVWKEKF